MRSVVHARLPWRLYSLVSQLNHLSSLPRLASLRHTPSAQRNITTTSLSPAPGPSPNQIQPNQDLGDPSSGGGEGKKQGNPKRFGAALDSAISTASGVLLLAGAGIFYHNWYKWQVLRKMGNAFAAGYDPVLALASAELYEEERHDTGKRKKKPGMIRRREQDYIDRVINGEVAGEYLLLLGPKGTGKTTLMVEAMIKNAADGVAMIEMHEDQEVVRQRLGKALDFEYNEDSFAGLFQRRDPREAGALLDIERALNKLEKVAIRYRQERGRPLCLIFNNIHFIHDDAEGHALLHALQQRAESWAGANVCTTIFSSDDYAPYRHLKKSASRMNVISVKDLTPSETHVCLAASRAAKYPGLPPLDPDISLKVWDLVGGRLSILSKLVHKDDLIAEAERLIELEKEWLHSRLGLIPDHDDDVMDEQKVSSCSFLLFQEFARLAEEDAEDSRKSYDTLAMRARTHKHGPNDVPPEWEEAGLTFPDPAINYRRAREIMTRPDYVTDLDHHNIINVDVEHKIRPDSRLMLSVFRKICAEPDFQEKLDNVRDRVDEIESLHRTSELTVKKENDLGGILRLRMGQLSKGPSQVEEGDGVDESEAPIRLV